MSIIYIQERDIMDKLDVNEMPIILRVIKKGRICTLPSYSMVRPLS
jgi:hypothetical protein